MPYFGQEGVMRAAAGAVAKMAPEFYSGDPTNSRLQRSPYEAISGRRDVVERPEHVCVPGLCEVPCNA